jgi:multiple sugar transport system substrate-binding protein
VKRNPRYLAVLAAVLGIGACSAGGGGADIAKSGTAANGTVTFWHFFKDAREQQVVASIVADFEKTHPKIKVKIRPAQDDEKMRQAIAAGGGPDVAMSGETSIVGSFCSSGAFRDLKPYLQRDKVDLRIFPKSVQDYTQYQGRRCTMPLLADDFGLYYNKRLLKQAGFTSPPKTMSELAEMSKKVTKRDPSGAIQVAGFVPFADFYSNKPSHIAPQFDAKWLTPDGKSAVGADTGWKAYAQWSKQLVDFYGADRLRTFTSGLGQYIAPDNGFNKGKIAFMLDGEYRLAFLKDQAPGLDFGVAPFPVQDGRPDLYGAGYAAGNVVGIPKGAKNPEAAWQLVRYLTTDTGAVVKLANTIKNIPTTIPAQQAPGLDKDANWQVFLDIFARPGSGNEPATRNGTQYADLTKDFLVRWQTGKVTDLDAGLKDLDNKINQSLQLGAG